MRLIIDTNAYAELAKGNAHIRKLLENADEIVVSAVVLGVLYAGFKLGSRKTENIQVLSEFLKTPGVAIIPIDSAIAERYGELIGVLKDNGTPIPTNDVWIAATALETGGRILTSDSHFHQPPGLMMVLRLR